MEGEIGMAGRGNCQLRPESTNFCFDKGTAEMLPCRGIRDTKRCTHCHTHRSGAITCIQGCRGHTTG